MDYTLLRKTQHSFYIKSASFAYQNRTGTVNLSKNTQQRKLVLRASKNIDNDAVKLTSVEKTRDGDTLFHYEEDSNKGAFGSFVSLFSNEKQDVVAPQKAAQNSGTFPLKFLKWMSKWLSGADSKVVGVGTSPSELQKISAELGNKFGESGQLRDVKSQWRASGPAGFNSGLELQVAELGRQYSIQSSVTTSSSRDDSASVENVEEPFEALEAEIEATEKAYTPLNIVPILLVFAGLFQLARVGGATVIAPIFKSIAVTGSPKPLVISLNLLPCFGFGFLAFLFSKFLLANRGLFEYGREGNISHEIFKSELGMVAISFFKKALPVFIFTMLIPLLILKKFT